MTSDSLFVLAVSILTLGGVFFYLLRVEALAKKLEERVRDQDLASPSATAPLAHIEDTTTSAPISSANSLGTSVPGELPR